MAERTVQQVQLRIPIRLLADIDARIEKLGRSSRNEWLVQALEWAVAQPVKTVTTTEKV